MSSENNYFLYRSLLNTIDEAASACVPSLAIVLYDIVQIENELKNILIEPRAWINREKMSRIGKVLWNYRKFFSEYAYFPVEELQQYLVYSQQKALCDGKPSVAEVKKMKEREEMICPSASAPVLKSSRWEREKKPSPCCRI